VRDTDTPRFYALLGELDRQLEGPRQHRNCTASSGWPLNGVYFFFEAGENPDSWERRTGRAGGYSGHQDDDSIASDLVGPTGEAPWSPAR
jgi:hypothetical protein